MEKQCENSVQTGFAVRAVVKCYFYMHIYLFFTFISICICLSVSGSITLPYSFVVCIYFVL